MKKIALYIFTVLLFVACHNDKNDISIEAASFDISLLEGEWVTIDKTGNNITDLTLTQAQRVQLFLLHNVVGRNSISKEDKGSWTTNEGKQIISFEMLNLTIPNQEIIELNDNYMKLRNQILNFVDTYYRVVETIEIDAGQVSYIQFIQNNRDSRFDEIKSLNPNIASIDSDGLVKGHQGGTVFLSMKLDQKIFYAKVIVKSRIDKYEDETQLWINDIINLYGEPDMKIQQVGEDVDCIIYHENLPDSALDFLAYIYNSYGQIGTIQTIYRSEDTYNDDISYLQEYYYKQKTNSGDMYGKSAFQFENSSLVIPTCKNGPYINYINNKFYTEEWLIDIFNKDTYDKKTPKELYKEPYTIWGCSVSEVQSFMSNCEIAAELQRSDGGDYWMAYYGVDYNGKTMAYEYHFDTEDSGLERVYVTLSQKNNYTVDDLLAHLAACGYQSAGYDSNLGWYLLYSPIINNNMYSSVSVYLSKNGNPTAFYLRTFYDQSSRTRSPNLNDDNLSKNMMFNYIPIE